MRIVNWKDPHVNKILLPYFIGAKNRVKHRGKNFIGYGKDLIWYDRFLPKKLLWSYIEILFKSHKTLIGILYVEILKKS